jgi:phospholipid/cholesterol/gamma-HCH transport system substrate-binding protein
MSENRTEVLVGGLVIAVAAAFLAYVTLRTDGVTTSRGYDLVASFRSAEGISVGTDVRLAGVKVGSVTGLALNDETFRADATLSIRQGLEIPDDSSAVVASEGLLGGSYVELQPGGSPFNYEAGEEIFNTQGAVSLLELLSKFVGSGSEG